MNVPEEKPPMKRLLIGCCTAVLAASTFVAAQTPAPKPPPKSPPVTATATIAGKTISIAYSSPRVNGRGDHIFAKDGLIGQDPSYPIWRAGANAATVLHTDADLTIGTLDVPKGEYSLWVNISDANHWVLVVNKQFGQWGRTYDAAKNLGTTPMDTKTTPALVEDLKYTITDLGGGKGTITLAWENKSASVSFMAK
jgi:hypothetical protein